MSSVRLPRNPWWRAALLLPPFVLAGVLVWWRGPDWSLVYHAFDFVEWRWIVAAFLLNVLSVLARSLSWSLTVAAALDPPEPRFRHVISAFSIGLLANAVLPGRIGELARVAVLRQHLPHGRGTSAALVGTVIAHRLFDVVPAVLLVVYVLLTANIPGWAVTSIVVVSAVGIVLLTFAVLSARRDHRPVLDELGTVRRLLAMARQGFSVMRNPIAAAGAVFLQCLGWGFQLLAVYVAMRAFDIEAPLPAAGLVLVLMNIATIFPLWPGNVGLVQAAVALPLVSYGVAYPTGFAYGIALQAVEVAVGVSAGLLALAPEGISFATLRGMPDARGSLEEDADELAEEVEEEADALRERAGVSG